MIVYQLEYASDSSLFNDPSIMIDSVNMRIRVFTTDNSKVRIYNLQIRALLKDGDPLNVVSDIMLVDVEILP